MSPKRDNDKHIKSSFNKQILSNQNPKKVNHKKNNPKKDNLSFSQGLTIGQRAADSISKFGGSWTFIILVVIFLLVWMGFNTYFLLKKAFDPYPFILLNLVLSCMAALQAPIILMAQNRQAERDRINAKYDYEVNRKAEREIQVLQKDILYVKSKISDVDKKIKF